MILQVCVRLTTENGEPVEGIDLASAVQLQVKAPEGKANKKKISDDDNSDPIEETEGLDALAFHAAHRPQVPQCIMISPTNTFP